MAALEPVKPMNEWFFVKTPEERFTEKMEGIVTVYSKVYGMAKLILEILKAYGTETDGTPNGLKYHIKRAENDMNHNSPTQLLKMAAHLYYALYARLDIEIANVQLCETFKLDVRKSGISQATLVEDFLPDSSQLHSILQACKHILMKAGIVGCLDEDCVRAQQADHVSFAVESCAAAGYEPDDYLGYRRHIQNLLSDSDSDFCKTWNKLYPVYKVTPGMVLATLSEKYLALRPKRTVSHKRRLSELSNNSVSSTASTIDIAWEERKTVFAHREAAYAILNGMAVGEYRRLEGKWPLSGYIKENLCICFGYCSCSKKCTVKGARECPCNTRMKIICDVEEQHAKPNFPEKFTDLAASIIEGLYLMKPDTTRLEMHMELKDGLDIFHAEIVEYRRMFCARR